MSARRKHKVGLSLRKAGFTAKKAAIALSVPGLLVGAIVEAQDAEPLVLETIKVEVRAADTNPYAETDAPYKAKVSGDDRHVEDLADTPQTITVLTQTQIKESGKSDLRDVLAAQPGITLGTGENGNSFGDRYVIRGHEARSDVFVDGLRDPGMTTRESFAVEQIEITKGPSATFAGRGSSGGAVNGITKQASTDYDFTKVQAGIGTDKYKRVELDANQRVNDDLALRANILYSDRDVPDRSPADKERIGAALSAAYQATDKLQIIGDFYYLDAHDKPDLGAYIDRTSGNVVEVPSYVQDEDFLDSEVKTFTLHLKYGVNDRVSIQNSTRYGTTKNGYVATGAGGSARDETDPDAPGADTITFSTHQGWQEVDYFVNQLNIYFDTDILGTDNQFIFSTEYSNMNVLNGNYSNTNTGETNCIVAGRGGVSPSYCGLDANGNAVAGLNSLLKRDITKGDSDSDYNVETLSLSVMDTVEISDKFSVFAGLRLDDFSYSNEIAGRAQAGEEAPAATDYSYSDTLWNGHLGGVYKITDEGNVYLTYSTATNINGGESDVGGNCGYGGICGDSVLIGESKPEKLTNIELGTKWDLFNEKLLATAAIFRITKDDVMEGADYTNTGTLNTGKNRVEGFEVSLTGQITDKLSAQFGAAIMSSEILKSFNNGINETTGRDGTLQTTSDDRGKPLANFADESLYLQLRYAANDKFSFGGAATYSSEVFTGQPDTAANEELGVPDYTVFDLFANYAVNDQLSFRLNIGNVTDEDYYLTAYRSGTFAYIGDARNAQLTVAYEF